MAYVNDPDDLKPRSSPFPDQPQTTGFVRRMNAARGYGFIECGDGTSRFFHRTMCATPFELLRDGDVVYFTPDDTSDEARAKGSRATFVQKLRVSE